MTTDKALHTLIGLAISIGLTAAVVCNSRIDASHLTRAFESADYLPWVPLSLLAYVIGMLLRGGRLAVLVERDSVLVTIDASNIVAIGYAVNNLLPARLGELARAWVLSERTGLPYAQTLGLTFIERSMDGLVIVAIFALSAARSQDAMAQGMAVVAMSIFMVASGIALTMALLPEMAVDFVSLLTQPLGNKAHDAAVSAMSEMVRGFTVLRDGARAMRLVILSFAVWAAEALMFACILPCFALASSYLDYVKALAVMSATNLGILLPSTPGFVGTYHMFCSSAMQTFFAGTGITASVALSYAVIVHFIFFATVTIWGALAISVYGIEFSAFASLNRSLMKAQSTPVQATAQIDRASQPDAFWLALTEAILSDCANHGLDKVPVVSVGQIQEARRQSTCFMLRQLDALPRSLNLACRLAAACIAFAAICSTLKPFADLSLDTRKRAVDWLSYRGPGFGRRFFKLLRSLLLLAYFENASVIRSLEASEST